MNTSLLVCMVLYLAFPLSLSLMILISESYEYRILGYYAGETTPWEFCISQHGICRPTHLVPPWEFLAIVHHFCRVALWLLTLGPFAFILSSLPLL